MLLPIRRVLKRLFPRQVLCYKAYSALIGDTSSYLYETGWMHSLQEYKPTSHKGTPVPWLNYPTLRLLEERLGKDMELFEFGSGYSTNFFARRVKSVTSVEYDKGWFELINKDKLDNVELIYRQKDIDGAYCRSITRPFDMVIVDGRDRVNCLIQSMSQLNPRGVILLDDSQRARYRPGIDHLKNNGFRALSIEGLKPGGVKADQTTLLYREGNCLGI